MSNPKDSENLSIDDLASEVETTPVVRDANDQDKALLASMSPNPQWNLLQEYLIEIYAENKIREADGQRFPYERELIELLKRKIEREHDGTIKDSLLRCVPSRQTINRWTKLSDWNKSVTDRMKAYGFFTQEKLAAVVNSLYNKAVKEGDTTASKIWLTMAGHYDEKGQESNDKFDKYKQIIEAMSKKQSSS